MTDADVLSVVAQRLEAGKHTLLWYMMESLPTSGAEDRLRFLELLGELPAGLMVRIHFEPFTKRPHTPLVWARCHFEADEYAFAKRLMRIPNTAKTVIQPGRGEAKHLLATGIAVGTARMAELLVRYGTAMESWSASELRSAFRAIGMPAERLFDEWPATEDLPWGWYDASGSDPERVYRENMRPLLAV